MSRTIRARMIVARATQESHAAKPRRW